jgi:glycosyltransferase involved in cell wall biosynthesis
MPATHLVLIPSYNTGAKLLDTVAEALQYWPHIWVIIDGSTDDSAQALADAKLGVKIIHRPQNGGKGAAIFDGLQEAARQKFTHVLTMDADGQHPAGAIPEFINLSADNPNAMILGVPIFDHTAPRLRVWGRKISNTLARLEADQKIGDALFGFRVYPLHDLLNIMTTTPHMRGFDFDPEAVIRLAWRGMAVLNHPAPVRYFSKQQGGISHFHYVRDNAVLAAMHARLITSFLVRRLVKPSRH